MSRLNDIYDSVIVALNSPAWAEDEKFVIEGEEFHVHADNKHISVWAHSGTRSIYNADIKGQEVDNFIGEIAERIEEYCEGYVHCTDCGKKFPISEINNYKRSYFAGVFCQDCWDRKWKDIEAKETYN